MLKDRGFWEAVLVLGLGLAYFILLWRLRKPVPQSRSMEQRLPGVDGC